MSTLPKETIERIDKEADHYAKVQCGDPGKFTEIIERLSFDNSKEDYIAGATAETERAQVLVEALKIIQGWQLPPTGKFWDKEETRPLSFEATYGSNGVRDFMKGIADNALSAYEGKEVENG